MKIRMTQIVQCIVACIRSVAFVVILLISLPVCRAQVQMKGVAQFEMPEEFKKRLERNAQLANAFQALTPGRQKAYLLYFAGAKQSATRVARVDKHAPRIMQGLGLDD